MREKENQCVGCPAEIGCLGSSCPYMNVLVAYCDQCGKDGAEFVINHEDYCENCANRYLQETFDELTIEEKAKVLGVNLSMIDREEI